MGAPTVYLSSDASAPVLSGQVDKLNDLLYACLVTGYGAKSAAGWSRPYAAGNTAVFRPASGLRRYLRVDDSAAQLARAHGYDTMSALSTGTGMWPRDYQYIGASSPTSGGLYLHKSITADATARPWALIANEHTFYMVSYAGSTTLSSYGANDCHLGFGELLNPAFADDTYCSFVIGAEDDSLSGATAGPWRQMINYIGLDGTTNSRARGNFAYSDYTGLATPYRMPKGTPSVALSNSTTAGLSGGGSALATSGLDPAAGTFNISRIVGLDRNFNSIRGRYPGLWAISHLDGGYTTLDTFTGKAGTSLASRTFLILGSGTGGVAFETTDGSW